MIAVVDYGMGNLRSVSKALESVGASVEVTSDARRVLAADGVVLPGVGAFGRCMENLVAAGLREPVREVIAAGRPFLGICVGMQILFEESEEFGPVRGLAILPGKVRRFDATGGLKVPHMGWNRLSVRRAAPHLAGIADGERAYFVHSYYVETPRSDLVATSTNYGCEFVSSAWSDNVFATQFHPEKSQRMGLRLLANFSDIVAGRRAA
jgi:glutamine amidotransferase